MGFDRALLRRSPLEVAPALLGAILSVGDVALRITEVEAYLGVGEDPGSHSFRGRTKRNSVMFGDAGHLYVYFTYGMHTCANVVCSPLGESGGVLIRAGEIVEGIDLTRERRTTSRRDTDLAQGPARLTVALGIAMSDDGADLETSRIRLDVAAPLSPSLISTGPRTGVSGAGGGADYPWRFWITGDPTVSRYKASIRP
ncbi:DNA-3-methyladenine glycosylase [Glaciihabitans arcticus]|uniref:Putative 3-methyladenine DNA glycosylase n=1 Tax=Glaciihabitans arcticus TaxID=2668039 RepID=A0A4Q9GQA4_9MICO|nr:DNA-3-methyladenine glycosylase [Glaciihabitans arcticus]TBN56154.1 DNA-3-methyladenine glycosylase [Glaciihabitans arcticus]